MRKWILILWLGLSGQYLLAQQPDLDKNNKIEYTHNKNEDAPKIIWQAQQSFGNPTIPATLQVVHYQGDINIEGYTGKEVMMEAWYNRQAMGGEINEQIFKVLENNNLMALLIDSSLAEKIGNIHLKIKVPEKTTLKIVVKKRGDVRVQNVNRLVEIDNRGGAIFLQDLGGWAIAQTENGKIEASFKEIVANQPMSFMTLNGEIDLKFPSDLAADFRIRSANGLINNEFGEIAKSDSLTNLNYMNNTSQSANFFRSNDINLQEKNLPQKQAAARGGNDQLQFEQKTKTGTGNPKAKNMQERAEENVKNTTRNRRSYTLSQVYVSKAHIGGGLIYISTRTGKVEIRKTISSRNLMERD
ncbi:MAG: hypothetical protein MUE85_06745 [Microscillaceae bacterium]|jgi:hypothetical protein|nr:hypothetical protein [Microscillaceae bacterium]